METVASVRSKRQRKGESRAVTGRNTKFAEHVPQKKREIVPDEGTNERKGALSLKCLPSVWNTKYAIISRGAESA